MSYCEANDLAVGYNSPLLEHIKFAAERGQILTLIGPNGAGKSTLMKTLAAQLAPQGGTVLLDGQLFRHDVGECPHGGFNCVAMPCAFVYAFQTDGGVPNG